MAKTLRLDGTTAPAFSIGEFIDGSQAIALDTTAITTAYALTMPETAGLSDQVLTTDGNGILSWRSVTPSPLPGEPNASYYTYNDDGNIVEITDYYGVNIAETTITYDDDNLVETVVTVYAGATTTKTYTYDADGNVISMVAVTV